MKRSFQIFVVGALVAVLTTLAFAAVPPMINYQGKLTDASGAPVNDTIEIVFSIYADTGGTNLLWTETQGAIVVEKGVFNVLLGSVDSIPYSVFDGSIRYLGVKVGDDPEITPRKPMVSVAYAYTDGDWTIDGDNVYRSQGNVGIGTTTPRVKLEVCGPIASYGSGFVSNLGGTHFSYNTYWDGMWKNLDSAQPGMLFRIDQGGIVVYSATTGMAPTLTPKGGWWYDGDVFYNYGSVGIGTTNPQEKLDVEGNVQAYAFNVGDIFFKKDKEKLWRMYEGEDGLYLENLKTGKIYRFILQEVEKK